MLTGCADGLGAKTHSVAPATCGVWGCCWYAACGIVYGWVIGVPTGVRAPVTVRTVPVVTAGVLMSGYRGMRCAGS